MIMEDDTEPEKKPKASVVDWDSYYETEDETDEHLEDGGFNNSNSNRRRCPFCRRRIYSKHKGRYRNLTCSTFRRISIAQNHGIDENYLLSYPDRSWICKRHWKDYDRDPKGPIHIHPMVPRQKYVTCEGEEFFESKEDFSRRVYNEVMKELNYRYTLRYNQREGKSLSSEPRNSSLDPRPHSSNDRPDTPSKLHEIRKDGSSPSEPTHPDIKQEPETPSSSPISATRILDNMIKKKPNKTRKIKASEVAKHLKKSKEKELALRPSEVKPIVHTYPALMHNRYDALTMKQCDGEDINSYYHRVMNTTKRISLETMNIDILNSLIFVAGLADEEMRRKTLFQLLITTDDAPKAADLALFCERGQRSEKDDSVKGITEETSKIIHQRSGEDEDRPKGRLDETDKKEDHDMPFLFSEVFITSSKASSSSPNSMPKLALPQTQTLNKSTLPSGTSQQNPREVVLPTLRKPSIITSVYKPWSSSSNGNVDKPKSINTLPLQRKRQLNYSNVAMDPNVKKIKVFNITPNKVKNQDKVIKLVKLIMPNKKQALST
ncbi:unnamed protein product [Bursaphelenchus okinawaensis]|uniref:Uncharacterized protein n=1 Tax=Bursaphelenchus okinawaensis TaxID=465554 RepID=A0A811LHN2_9BILA|nr:unnamed protein product [Bursaphelenchus okinawaensis]CAG9125693.1 unnamed protein product [Bursaphelenchus okinawaensis]